MTGIYGRQSVDKKDSISIETQIELCKREVADGQAVKLYTDKGYSGSNINRPAFQELLSDIQNGKITKVIIYRLDRMSRSILDFAKLIEFFKKYGVEFQSTQEKFDTSTPIGNAMLSITMVFAQLERETIQQRIKDNYYARGKQGSYLGGPPPFGCEKVNLTINGKTVKAMKCAEEKSGLLNRIFSMYGYEQYSLGEIARTLNTEGIPSPTGVRWDSCRISMLLRNPVYVKSDTTIFNYYKAKNCIIENDVEEFVSGNGCCLYGKRKANTRKYTDITDHRLSLALHPGIIEAELFLKCQARLDSNTQLNNKDRGKHSWLTGIVKCKKCGHSFVVRTSNNCRYKYWYCSGRANGGCDNRLKKMSIDKTEEIARYRIFEVVDQNKDILVEQKEEHRKEKNLIQSKIASLNQQADKLIQFIIEGNEVTKKYLDAKLNAIDAEKQRLEFEYQQVLDSESGILQSKQLFHVIDDWDSLTQLQKKEIASQFIEKVYVDDDAIDILWKHNFSRKQVESDY